MRSMVTVGKMFLRNIADCADPSKDVGEIVSCNDEVAIADIKKQLEQLELGHGWQNINTTSRQKYLQYLRKQVAKSESRGGI